MIRFGHFYLNGKLMVYDVTVEVQHGRRVYIASLSEDPRVAFAAIRDIHAIELLKDHLARVYAPLPGARMAWAPADPRTVARV